MSTAVFPSTVFPTFGITRTPKFRTQIIEYGNKVEQRISFDSTVQNLLKLNFPPLSATAAEVVLDFFIARKGAYDSFQIRDWWGETTASTVVYQVRFKDDMQNMTSLEVGLRSLGEISLIEVSC